MKLLAFILSAGIVLMACNNSGNTNQSTSPNGTTDSNPYLKSGDLNKIDSMGNTRDSISLDSIRNADSLRRLQNR